MNKWAEQWAVAMWTVIDDAIGYKHQLCNYYNNDNDVHAITQLGT